MIENYSIKQFNDDKSKWMKSGHTTWFVHGNLDKDEALKLCMEVNGMLKLK